MREDLPEIVALVRAQGFSFVQLNTNGVRLGRDREYVRQLKNAGLGCVFLQFDGVSEDVHQMIRGCDLVDIALDLCSRMCAYRICPGRGACGVARDYAGSKEQREPRREQDCDRDRCRLRGSYVTEGVAA